VNDSADATIEHLEAPLTIGVDAYISQDYTRAGGKMKMFVCGFHGWRFNLDGEI
jgi:hypothetical protein